MKGASYLGSLAQLCCWEGHTLQTNKYLWHVWGTLAVGNTGVATAQGRVHFQVPATQAPRWSVRTQSQVSRVSCPLPSSKLLRFSRATSVGPMNFPGPSCSGSRVHGECTVPSEPWISCPSQVEASQALGCVTHVESQVDHASGIPARSKLLGFLGVPWGADSQVVHASPYGSWSQAVTLLEHMNCPGSQYDMVGYRQPAHSLMGDVVEIALAPCLPTLAIEHLPLCLRESHNGQTVCSPLVWSFVLWACQVSQCGVRAFLGERSFLFSLSLFLVFPWFGLLCHISPLWVSSRHSTPILTLRTQNAAHISVLIPHSLWADVSLWAASWLVIAVQCEFCGDFYFFSVILLSEIPKLATDSAL